MKYLEFCRRMNISAIKSASRNLYNEMMSLTTSDIFATSEMYPIRMTGHEWFIYYTQTNDIDKSEFPTFAAWFFEMQRTEKIKCNE